jgi:hypothetical protein
MCCRCKRRLVHVLRPIRAPNDFVMKATPTLAPASEGEFNMSHLLISYLIFQARSYAAAGFSYLSKKMLGFVQSLTRFSH